MCGYGDNLLSNYDGESRIVIIGFATWFIIMTIFCVYGVISNRNYVKRQEYMDSYCAKTYGEGFYRVKQWNNSGFCANNKGVTIYPEEWQ